MMLADMGAEVLKIEAPPSGKLAGSGASPTPDQARKLATNFTNRNKKSITLNLKEAAGQAVLQDLAKDHDVLVEGFRPGVMGRLGGDYDTLSKLNPRLVYCSLSGFGQDGPYRDYPAHDLNYLALGGVLNLIGQPEGPPAIPLNIIADYAGASMHGRDRHHVCAVRPGSVPARASWSTCPTSTPPSPCWRPRPMCATILPTGPCPAGARACLAAGSPTTACTIPKTTSSSASAAPSRGCGTICVTRWTAPDWKDCGMKAGDFSQTTTERHQQVRQELQAVLMTKTCDEWYDFLTKADVCVGKVYDVPEVFDDPQVRHRQMAVELDHPQAGKVTQAGVAVKLSDTPGSIRSFAPSIGQHTQEVLDSLGYSADKIAQLRDKRVV